MHTKLDIYVFLKFIIEVWKNEPEDHKQVNGKKNMKYPLEDIKFKWENSFFFRLFAKKSEFIWKFESSTSVTRISRDFHKLPVTSYWYGDERGVIRQLTS